MAAIERNEEELKAESKTLWYEFNQLCGVVELLNACNGRHPDKIVHNALVESFAIHCRAICFFFFAGRPVFGDLKRDDLGAKSYIAAWDTICPAPTTILINAKYNCDKQVAH